MAIVIWAVINNQENDLKNCVLTSKSCLEFKDRIKIDDNEEEDDSDNK